METVKKNLIIALGVPPPPHTHTLFTLYMLQIILHKLISNLLVYIPLFVWGDPKLNPSSLFLHWKTKKEVSASDVGGKPQGIIPGKTHAVWQGLKTHSAPDGIRTRVSEVESKARQTITLTWLPLLCNICTYFICFIFCHFLGHKRRNFDMRDWCLVDKSPNCTELYITVLYYSQETRLCNLKTHSYCVNCFPIILYFFSLTGIMRRQKYHLKWSGTLSRFWYQTVSCLRGAKL